MVARPKEKRPDVEITFGGSAFVAKCEDIKMGIECVFFTDDFQFESPEALHNALAFMGLSLAKEVEHGQERTEEEDA